MIVKNGPLTWTAFALLTSCMAQQKSSLATDPAGIHDVNPFASCRAQEADCLEGELTVLVEDRSDQTHKYSYEIKTQEDSTYEVKMDGHDSGLLSGMKVVLKGNLKGPSIHIDNIHQKTAVTLKAAPFSVLPYTFGVQKTALLLVNFRNDTSQPTTIDDMKKQMAWSSEFFKEASYQQTSLEVDVYGWFTLPIAGGSSNSTCPRQDIKTFAEQAATAAGIDLSKYTRRIYLFPLINVCGFSGLSTVGGTPSSAWFNGVPVIGVINHELGHSLGLYHSNALACQPNVITGPCSNREYGDAFDTMGNGNGHFNAFQKSRLGWLDFGVSPEVLQVTASGTYFIDQMELPSRGYKALRISRGGAETFYVEKRSQLGWDSSLVRTGVFVHLSSNTNGNSSQLLDMEPSTIAYSTDGMLKVGQTFTDPLTGISIKTLSESRDSATLQIQMAGALPPGPGPGPSPSPTPTPTPPPAPPSIGKSLSDNFDRSSGALKNSWSVIHGELNIKSGKAVSGLTKAYHTAIQPGFTGANMSASAVFAKVSKTGASRLGVILRFVDENNYYFIGRQTGGSSQLKIVRVLNGIEKILGKVNLRNPTTAFQITGRGRGSTLTLELDGVTKLTVTDSSFAMGAVGLHVGTPKARNENWIDDFVATSTDL